MHSEKRELVQHAHQLPLFRRNLNLGSRLLSWISVLKRSAAVHIAMQQRRFASSWNDIQAIRSASPIDSPKFFRSSAKLQSPPRRLMAKHSPGVAGGALLGSQPRTSDDHSLRTKRLVNFAPYFTKPRRVVLLEPCESCRCGSTLVVNPLSLLMSVAVTNEFMMYEFTSFVRERQ